MRYPCAEFPLELSKKFNVFISRLCVLMQMPSKPSSFLTTVLQPLKESLCNFPSDYKKEWIQTIVELVTEK